MIYLFFKLLSFSCLLWGAVPDWSENTKLNSPRFNIYQLNEAKFKQTITAGKKHALIYPVDVTGLLIPYEPLKYFFETDEQDPVRKYIFSKLQNKTQFYSIDDLLNWLGLHSYPETQEENPLDIPHVDPLHATHAMGTTLLKTKNGIGITFSCAACHSADLFGKKILGMTNRFPKANEFFHLGKQVSPFINSYLFQMGLKTTQGERLMIKKVKNTLPWVGTKKPQVLGLDTSLSQVALSLSKREQDEYASRTPQSALFPRHNT